MARLVRRCVMPANAATAGGQLSSHVMSRRRTASSALRCSPGPAHSGTCEMAGAAGLLSGKGPSTCRTANRCTADTALHAGGAWEGGCSARCKTGIQQQGDRRDASDYCSKCTCRQGGTQVLQRVCAGVQQRLGTQRLLLAGRSASQQRSQAERCTQRVLQGLLAPGRLWLGAARAQPHAQILRACSQHTAHSWLSTAHQQGRILLRSRVRVSCPAGMDVSGKNAVLSGAVLCWVPLEEPAGRQRNAIHKEPLT